VKPLLSPTTLDRLAVLDVGVRRAAGGGRIGDRAAGVAGAGTIFHEHRTYTPGDDLRYVDWNAYSRLGTLHVKVFELEENLDVRLLVDATASMGSGAGSKLEAGLRAAAMVGATALARGDVVRFGRWPGRGTATFAGSAATQALLAAMQAPAEPGARTPLSDAVRAAMPPVRRRGFALLVTDFLDDPAVWRRAIDYLCHLRVELTCLHVVAREERDPHDGGTLRLRDSETGEMFEIEVDDDLLERYRTRFDKWLREVRTYLGSKRVRHVVVDTAHAAEPDLLRQLLREGVLR
jgi:uncharacterized protein (DUF58 family)